MRLITFRRDGGLHAGRVDGEQVVELPFTDVGAVLASGPDWRARSEEVVGPRHLASELTLCPPVPSPGKFLCVGLNYADHIAETGKEPPKFPELFNKYANSLVGPQDPIALPEVSEMVDWEVKLAVVIGQPVRRADPVAAEQAIAGYTVHNDISVRDWQRRTSQWMQGKIFERTSPLGPAVVTLDELSDPDDLEISCLVDEEVVQASRTSMMLWKPVDLVSYISQICTLDPGDIIATGTPGGVGVRRTPPRFLRPGSTVRSVITGVGETVNTCVSAAKILD